MVTAADATVAELEQKLDQASKDLAKVKRTASIVGGIVVGGGVIWLAWKLFSSYRQPEKPPDGA